MHQAPEERRDSFEIFYVGGLVSHGFWLKKEEEERISLPSAWGPEAENPKPSAMDIPPVPEPPAATPLLATPLPPAQETAVGPPQGIPTPSATWQAAVPTVTRALPPELAYMSPGTWRWIFHKGHSAFFQPLSGLWVLGLDWTLFGGNSLSCGVFTCLMLGGGLFLGGLGTTFIQRYFGGDGVIASLAKGLLGGLVVGVPFPVAGTFAGVLVLGIAGLTSSRQAGLAMAARHLASKPMQLMQPVQPMQPIPPTAMPQGPE